MSENLVGKDSFQEVDITGLSMPITKCNYLVRDVNQLADVSRVGINKINVDTDIRLACTRNIMELFLKNPALKESPAIAQVYRDMTDNPRNFDPRNYVGSIMDAILHGKIEHEHVALIDECMQNGAMEAIAPLLVQFGSYRKSHLIELVTCEQMADRYKKEGI